MSGDFANLLVGDVVPEVLPVPILIIVVAVLAWLDKRLRFGIGLYAIGSDVVAARASRVNVRLIRFLSLRLPALSLAPPACLSPPMPDPAIR